MSEDNKVSFEKSLKFEKSLEELSIKIEFSNVDPEKRVAALNMLDVMYLDLKKTIF